MKKGASQGIEFLYVGATAAVFCTQENHAVESLAMFKYTNSCYSN